MAWQAMKTAPKDRTILARRHNDVFYEHCIVFWDDIYDKNYPWRAEYTAYSDGRLEEWHEIPE